MRRILVSAVSILIFWLACAGEARAKSFRVDSNLKTGVRIVYVDGVETAKYLSSGSGWKLESGRDLMATLGGTVEEKITMNDGKTYIVKGNMVRGKRHGKQTMFYENGKLYGTGTYQNGFSEGEEKTYSESGKLVQVKTYKKGKIEGVAKVFYESGRLKQQVGYKNGKQHGAKKQFYESGKLQALVNFRDGVAYGDATFYHENGKIKSVFKIVNGEISGDGKHYDESGNPVAAVKKDEFEVVYSDEESRIFVFNNGAPVAAYDLNTRKLVSGTDLSARLNGPIKCKWRITDSETFYGMVNFEAGCRTGYAKYFYDRYDGDKKAWEGGYKNDRLEGPFRGYYRNGNLQATGIYSEGQADGIFRAYNEDGSLDSTIEFRNGRMVDGGEEEE